MLAGWTSGDALFLYWEVLGSNLDLHTGYADRGFMWFSSVSPGIFFDSTCRMTMNASSQTFLIVQSSSQLQLYRPDIESVAK
jgi:hypothetical protein